MIKWKDINLHDHWIPKFSLTAAIVYDVDLLHHRSMLGHASSQYWWQGPESPFKEGAGQNQGIQSGAKRPGQTVVGCSGDGCGGSFGVSASASSFSSSNNGGGSCCNLYWQKPNHPCSTHQGPDCPSGFSCVNYRSCSNGVISPFNSGYGNSGKPSLREVRNSNNNSKAFYRKLRVITRISREISFNT